MIEVGDIPDYPNALGGTTPLPNDNSQFTITLNENWIPTNASLDIARTLLHEGIHAEMSRKVASIGGLDNLDAANFPGIYDYYRRYYKNWSHELMATHYREMIARASVNMIMLNIRIYSIMI